MSPSDKYDYLSIQLQNLRIIEKKAGYANNGMLINYFPSPLAYQDYTAYVRALCDLEKAIEICIQRLNTLVCAETLDKRTLEVEEEI